MSSELYDKFVKNNRIDQEIYESEKEMESGGVSIGLDEAFWDPEKISEWNVKSESSSVYERWLRFFW